ncbi:hypothetical protein KCU65_g390, partial [Aureobasidium melanogenum]
MTQATKAKVALSSLSLLALTFPYKLLWPGTVKCTSGDDILHTYVVEELLARAREALVVLFGERKIGALDGLD